MSENHDKKPKDEKEHQEIEHHKHGEKEHHEGHHGNKHEHHHHENGSRMQYAELMGAGILIGALIGAITTLLLSSRSARQMITHSGGLVLHTAEGIAEPAKESISSLREIIKR